MRYYLIDDQARRIGPYTADELALFRTRGLLAAGATVVREDDDQPRPLDEALGSPGAATAMTTPAVPPRLARPGAEAGGEDEGTTGATREFLRLAPHLMLPIEDLKNLRWLENRRIVALAVIGLLPLFLFYYLNQTRNLGGAIWGVALYSSLLWALFFYVAFSQPEVRVGRCLLTFAGSAIFSIGLVALARFIVPYAWVMNLVESAAVTPRWSGHFLGVALIEETSKLFMLYFLWVERPRPRVMMFYGLIAGLGFGVYEGVTYQSSQNLKVSFPGHLPTEVSAGIYYILNVLRLTSIPFLHAMWTGIAGYFIGFAAQYPARRRGLLLAAILVPSLLHATYNTFSDTVVGLTVAVVTVIALNVYLVKGRDFERVLTDPRAI